MRPPAALLALPVAVLASCGGGSPKDDIRSIVENGAKDPPSLCEHLAADVLKQIGGEDKCKDLAKSGDNTDRNVKINSIEVEGDKGTAKVTGKDGDQTLIFRKEDGEWRLTTE